MLEAKSSQEKCDALFEALHIHKSISDSAIRALAIEMRKQEKPIIILAEKAVEYFKDKMEDEHTPLLLTVFTLVFYRVIFDDSIKAVTPVKIEEGKDNNNGHKNK